MLAPYVDFGSLGSAAGPLICRGAVLHGFWLKADVAKLQCLCERVFEDPSERQVRARPLLGAVMLTFGEIDAIEAGDPFGDRGIVTERQVGIWVPVEVHSRDSNGKERCELGMFIPYMWLDNPVSIATGREVYGYPKTYGWATFPGEPTRGREHDGTSSDCFQLDSFALKTFSPTTRPGRTPLLRVRPDPPEGDRLREVRLRPSPRLAGRIGRELRDLVPDATPSSLERGAVSPPRAGSWMAQTALSALMKLPRPLRRAFGRITGSPWWLRFVVGFGRGLAVNQFLMRQFRSPSDGELASLQNIIQAPARITNRPRVWLLGTHRIEIEPVDSDPLFDELGLESGRTYAEYRVEFDFAIESGEVIWPRPRKS